MTNFHVVARDILSQQVPRKRIPYAGFVYDEAEIVAAYESLQDSFKTGWFAFGEKCKLFEKKLAEYVGVQHAVFVNSGSSANLLAVGALISTHRLFFGDKIVTPATTFPTTVNALLMYRLRPVFVDIDLPSYTISAETIENAISATDAVGILLVHLNGSASDMNEIMQMAKRKGLVVIEDTSDALGTTIDGDQAGTFGDIGTFSFYVAHHMTAIEGGALCTNDPKLAETARSMRDWGRADAVAVPHNQATRNVERLSSKQGGLPPDYETRYQFVTQGFNLKPIEMQGAIALAQLAKLPDLTKKRKENYDYLYRGLESIGSNHLMLPQSLPHVDASWWSFPVILTDPAKERRKLTDYLEARGIETRPILAGDIREQPGFLDVGHTSVGNLTNTTLVLNQGFFVGVYPGLDFTDMNAIVTAFRGFFGL